MFDIEPPPGPGNDDIGDAIEEGIEDEIEDVLGEAAAEAEEQATEDAESEIVSELGSGVITTAGGLTIDIQQGFDLGQFIAGVPGNNNPNVPATAVGPIFIPLAEEDPLEIAQGYASNVGSNFNTGVNNQVNNVNTQIGNLGVSNINTGVNNPVNNAAGNMAAGNNFNLNLLNQMFNDGFLEP